MSNISNTNSTYTTGGIDTQTTLDGTFDATFQQMNGAASAAIAVQTVLGDGPTLEGTAGDLVTRLAVLLQASGAIKDKDGGTSYTKWDGWNGYGAATLAKRQNANPPGEIIMWGFTAIPAGFLELDSTQKSATTYEDLLDACIADLDTPGTTAVDWRRGTANHTIAQATDINTGTDTLTETAHGLSNGTVVHVASSVTIPTGLVTRTKYYLVGVTADTYQLSLTSGGSAVDITAVGTGTLSVYTTFQLPDARGRSPIGAGTGSGLTARALNTAYGEETHTQTEAELKAHTHSERVFTATVSGGANTVSAGNDFTATAANGGPTTASTGGGDPFNVIHPVITWRYLVRY